jgi:uncharacterized protein YbjQ (UPF0145 family)
MQAKGKVPIGTILKMYVHLRDQRDLHVKMAKDFSTQMGKVEAVLLKRMSEDETDRLGADGVVAFKAVQDKAHVSDFEKFLDFVITGERRDMLTSAVRQDAVKEFLAESGSLPPGVSLNRIVKVNVRKG